MMPLIQPLPNAYSKPSEYQKERAGFAELEVELRQRKGWVRGGRLWAAKLLQLFSRLARSAVSGGKVRRASR